MRRVQGPNGEEKSQQYEKDLSDLMAHRLIFSADHALCKEKIFLLFDALSQLPNFADVIELSKRACAIIASYQMAFFI